MISEKWSAKFDISQLVEHLQKYVLPLEPIAQSDAFAGWSVLSSNGSYKDGWHKGHLLLKKTQDPNEVVNSITQTGGQTSAAYIQPTEICHGYLKTTMEFIAKQNLSPRRARIIRLTPKSNCSWHRDSPDNLHAVRLHIPIITNEGCFFETRDERQHLPADGHAYFLRVNREHRVTNLGDDYRYHLVMDVTDLTGVTQFHRDPFSESLTLQNAT